MKLLIHPCQCHLDNGVKGAAKTSDYEVIALSGLHNTSSVK
jgi:hypothetical protein